VRPSPYHARDQRQRATLARGGRRLLPQWFVWVTHALATQHGLMPIYLIAASPQRPSSVLRAASMPSRATRRARCRDRWSIRKERVAAGVTPSRQRIHEARKRRVGHGRVSAPLES
jgi:hypothetical protein